MSRGGESAPEAEVIGVSRAGVRIRCPYCGREHVHAITPGKAVAFERFAPACGLERTPEQRAVGYRFTVPRTRQRRGPRDE